MRSDAQILALLDRAPEQVREGHQADFAQGGGTDMNKRAARILASVLIGLLVLSMLLSLILPFVG